ncbi:MAG TPA: ABC transporter ATP-binding protein [Casimicrobiaceae bacterium]|nr:ABC transporter ATP-binding protein [Casimicrobiaceae bacterium]
MSDPTPARYVREADRDNGTHAKLVVRGVAKSFVRRGAKDAQRVPVLRNVDLDVGANEFVSIIGGSGSGKTTLLRILAGLVPADDGSVTLDGRRISRPGRERAMVFQAINLLPWRNVLRNVEFGLEMQRAPVAQRRDAALRYVELVGLKDYAFAFPHELSGGMRQRVGIARALATEPDVLLMDEPFGSLDAQTGEFLWDELLKIVDKTRKTVVFVTHHIDEAIYLSDRVVVLGERPARIIESVPVSFRKPRWTYDVRAEPQFSVLRAKLRSLVFSSGPGGEGA